MHAVWARPDSHEECAYVTIHINILAATYIKFLTVQAVVSRARPTLFRVGLARETIQAAVLVTLLAIVYLEIAIFQLYIKLYCCS